MAFFNSSETTFLIIFSKLESSLEVLIALITSLPTSPFPFSWMISQAFRSASTSMLKRTLILLQNKAVDFSFRNVSYHVEIVGVDVFPQGFAAVADRLSDFRGVNMICDIGNGTMNIMFINDKKPVSGNMFTEKYGTHQCLLAVRENVMRAHHTTVDEAIINRVFHNVRVIFLFHNDCAGHCCIFRLGGLGLKAGWY